MTGHRLPVVVLQQVRTGPVQNADRTGRQGCGVTSGADAVTCRLVSVETDVGIIEEVVEDADGVGATADAGDDCVGQPTRSRHCWRVSLPMTRWNSRTISGNGAGPATVPSK